jgi:hypothetical protein
VAQPDKTVTLSITKKNMFRMFGLLDNYANRYPIVFMLG